MAVKFLDLTGLQKFWTKCKNAFVAKNADGDVSVTGNAAVNGGFSVNGASTLRDDVDIMSGGVLNIWDSEDDKQLTLYCYGNNGGELRMKVNGTNDRAISTTSYVEIGRASCRERV